MVSVVIAIVAYVRAFFVPRHRLALEAAALRQQLAVFNRNQPRPRLHRLDRLFWTALRRLYSGWADALILVKPEMVVSWHRAGFRLFWRWRSRQSGRPKVTKEIRELIRRLKAENPRWGAPRIHGELLQLGFEVSEPTVSRYLQGLEGRGDESKAKRWLAFLNNHREVIAAFDFFTVPTLRFQTLYCFFVIEHGRRRILHFNCTAHPTGEWIVQQLREALPLPCPYRYILFDRDAKFSNDVLVMLKASGIKPLRTSGAPGRTGSLNDGSAVLAAKCLITSSRSTNAISDASGVSIWRIITKTAHTSDWKRRRLPVGRSSDGRPQLAGSNLFLGLAVVHHRYSRTKAA